MTRMKLLAAINEKGELKLMERSFVNEQEIHDFFDSEGKPEGSYVILDCITLPKKKK